jgi:hypothetical protein
LRFIPLRTGATLATAIVWLAGSSGAATACAYHGAGNFSAAHPGAFDLAMAVQAAVDAGAIEAESTVPSASMVAYHRMVKQIEQFRDLLKSSARRPAVFPAFSLLLTDSALWSRLTPEPAGIALAIHTAEPGANEPVVLTTGSVIRSVLDGRLSTADALHRGLIRVEAAIDPKLMLFDLLAVAAKSDTPAAAVERR